MSKASSITPIRRQYIDIKRQYKDAILFFRLGDFYETFDEDAQTVANELDVVLTSRNVAKGQRIPMAGVPHHAAEGYIAKLIEKGYKVAICDQVSRERVDGLMPREVVRVVTPGTVVEPALLSEKHNNFLAAVVLEDDQAGVAYADITTGEFATTQFGGSPVEEEVVRELDRLAPAEILVSDEGDSFVGEGEARKAESARRYPAFAGLRAPLTLYDGWRFEQGNCRRALLEHFDVATLAGYGCGDLPLAVRAAGVIVQYLRENQPSALKQVSRLATYSIDSFMTLDVNTRRNLELQSTIREGRFKGSLLWVLDETLTPMGGRLLRRWLGQPLLEREALERRLTAVEVLFGNTFQRAALRDLLHNYGDLERLANRVIQGIAGPREVAGLKSALQQVSEVGAAVDKLVDGITIEGADAIYPLNGKGLTPCQEAIDLISRAIVDEPPATLSHGGVIREGYSEELDAIEASVADSKAWLEELEAREQERTGIKSLKVDSNQVFGYYIEVTNPNLEKVPAEYVRKQTLVNSERFIVPELKEHETIILNAVERTQELEAELFDDILEQLARMADQFLETARALAHLDVYASLAEVAAKYDYVRPELSDGDEIHIVGGRHPVVERTLVDGLFVPNDTDLSPQEGIHIITGPNMSGKSTYLRQVALITLLAQIGSFVPAESAQIGLVDRIFTRVGAQDEITAGQSTFMVEMVELANILNHATSKSLLILDEVGRGTSTYDGISIAWSTVEYIHNHEHLRCKTLFATHYHELTELESALPRVHNYNVAVERQGDQVVFTHHIVPGAADRSYGIHVAQMAGLPAVVIQRAKKILKDLQEAGQRVPADGTKKVMEVRQLPMFAEPNPVVQELRAIDVMSMSPLEAIEKLDELKKQV
ncbi:MAG: DNA mismatch repair protein MutS [Chloroflexota bacterium]|nr:DNA mismatch repair protein MutS [Chloroflexota bacterium]